MQMTDSADNDGSTLALKPMRRVNQSLTQKVPVAPQNGDIVTTKILLISFSSCSPC